jgi:hypothetical protein
MRSQKKSQNFIPMKSHDMNCKLIHVSHSEDTEKLLSTQQLMMRQGQYLQGPIIDIELNNQEISQSD